MRLGIIGVGFVGSAIKEGFELLGHSVEVYDPKYPESKFEDILSTECLFICVPTPQSHEGECDSSIVEETVERLQKEKYSGVIAIKSTVLPGTTEQLIRKYENYYICFVPEFLHERSATEDFIKNHDVLIVGTEYNHPFTIIQRAHGWIPENTIRVTPTEAELSKYFNNTFNALRIVYANAFYDLCEKMGSGASYSNVLNAVSRRNNIDKHYLRCNEQLRGFAGACLPKDTEAFANFAFTKGVDASIFETIINDNDLYKPTVFAGMRTGKEQDNNGKEKSTDNRKRGFSWSGIGKVFRK